jgi:hypothetical protein
MSGAGGSLRAGGEAEGPPLDFARDERNPAPSSSPSASPPPSPRRGGREPLCAEAMEVFLAGLRSGAGVAAAATAAEFGLTCFYQRRRRDASFAAAWAAALAAPGRPGRRCRPVLVDAAACGAFLQGLLRGGSRREAAAAGGFSLSAFERHRKRDPDFGAAWREAEVAGNRPLYVAPANGRRWQLQRVRRPRFDAARKGVFLDHFAGTCDLTAAAEAAGVCAATVNRHRRRDPAFAAECRAALEQGYERLHEEALRARLAAQEEIRTGRMPKGEATAEFDRQIKLLAQWRRRDGSIGPRGREKAAAQAMGFPEAVALLDRRLDALGVPLADGSDPSVARPAEAASPEVAPRPSREFGEGR